VQPVADSLGELLELADHQAEFVVGGGLVGRGLQLGLYLAEPSFGVAQPRFKLLLRQQAVFVGVDQAGDAPFELLDHRGQLRGLRGLAVWLFVQAPFVFLPHPIGILQQGTHVFPHGGFQQIGADLLVPTDAFAAETIGVGAHTAVVGIPPCLAFGRRTTHRLAVVGVLAALALNQPLEQVAGATLSLATVLFVLDESVLHCREEIFADDCRHGNAFLLLFRHRVDRVVAL
jgi:hypothetical protein